MRNEIQAGGLTGARFVDPVVLARVGNLELVSRAVVDGFITLESKKDAVIQQIRSNVMVQRRKLESQYRELFGGSLSEPVTMNPCLPKPVARGAALSSRRWKPICARSTKPRS